MKRVRFVLLLAAAALSLGCSASVTLSGRLLQAPAQKAGDENQQALADQRLLEAFGGDYVRAEQYLVGLGVEPREAARRVMDALKAAQAGKRLKAEEDGR